MKKTIILCSPTSEDMRVGLDEKGGMFFPPLGILLVAQSLKNEGYTVKFYDGNFESTYKVKLLSYVNKHADDILFIGFYLTLLQVRDMIEIVKTVRGINNEIKVVVGGPFPSVLPKVTMDSGIVDIACIGDGAKVVVSIADCGLDRESLREIPNISFKYNNDIVTNQRTVRDELNETTRIDYSAFINMEGYVNKFRVYLKENDTAIKRAVPILTGLGCSYKCSFCENALLNHKHVSLSAENIIGQIKFYHENYNIDSFSFFDEDFLFDMKRTLSLMALIKENGLKIKWGSQCRVNYFRESYVNTDFLRLLEESGCVRFTMGVETGSPAMLKKLRKGIKPEQVIRAAEYGKDSSIVFSYSLIVNLPEETYADVYKTVELMDKVFSIKKNSFVSAVHQYFSYPKTPLSIEMEQKLGVDPLKNITFEQFAKFDLNDYNKKVNPVKIDYRKECLIFYRLLNKVPQLFQFNIRIVARFLLRSCVGKIRQVMNCYSFPIEIYVIHWLRVNRRHLDDVRNLEDR
ncbi:MAG: B12-binding domain-containing radical SAM protein [Candidatus Brocadiaceae bacterium]|nr:B12-binding domain-containing radical SAM protein [Candidatus Brocadiaceae bacterium]